MIPLPVTDASLNAPALTGEPPGLRGYDDGVAHRTAGKHLASSVNVDHLPDMHVLPHVIFRQRRTCKTDCEKSELVNDVFHPA